MEVPNENRFESIGSINKMGPVFPVFYFYFFLLVESGRRERRFRKRDIKNTWYTNKKKIQNGLKLFL